MGVGGGGMAGCFYVMLFEELFIDPHIDAHICFSVLAFLTGASQNFKAVLRCIYLLVKDVEPFLRYILVICVYFLLRTVYLVH